MNFELTYEISLKFELTKLEYELNLSEITLKYRKSEIAVFWEI